jgi:hypothetical protein
MVPIARFLADISVRSTNAGAVADPVSEILSFVRAHPGTPEGVATIKVALQIIDCWGSLHPSDIQALSDHSIAVLNEFAKQRLRLRFSEEELSALAQSLDAWLSDGRIAARTDAKPVSLRRNTD